MPYALRRINIPGTLNAGYQRGSEIHESVIASWGLIEGEDWQDRQPDAELSTPAVPRPVDDSDRNAWVSYVVSRGTDPDEARDLDLSDLMDLYPEERKDDDMIPERPADSAKKAEWIDYVIGSGGPASWARDDSTTKAQLQEWQPGDVAGDESGTDQHTTDPAADQGNATVGQ